MPMPWTYRQASREWDAFLSDAREALSTPTDTMTYTAVTGVFRTFRRRLTPEQAIAFAQVLPAVLRALFVADWTFDAPLAPGIRADWTAEAKAQHPNHHLTPDDCVEAVALALRKSVLPEDLARVLTTLPALAAEYWSVPGLDTARLGPRIV